MRGLVPQRLQADAFLGATRDAAAAKHAKGRSARDEPQGNQLLGRMSSTTQTATLHADPEALLRRGKELVKPALQVAISELHPELEQVAAYHFGWAGADGARTTAGEGKAVRPTLAILSAQVAGGLPGEGLAEAAAVELVHNFSILHDDVMDGDRLRRHRPTAWSVFGTGSAVLAGDSLLALAGQVVGRSRAPQRARAAEHLNKAVSKLILGQAEDLSFESSSYIHLDEYLGMASHKTAALMACSTSIGAIAAGAPQSVCRALEEAGRHLGMAFQAVDDLLGIWGTESVTGKPVFRDLERRKKTLPVVAALNAGGAHSRELEDLLSGSSLDGPGVKRAAWLVENTGGRQHAVREATQRLEMALATLQDIPMAGSTRAELTSLARYLSTRNR